MSIDEPQEPEQKQTASAWQGRYCAVVVEFNGFRKLSDIADQAETLANGDRQHDIHSDTHRNACRDVLVAFDMVRIECLVPAATAARRFIGEIEKLMTDFLAPHFEEDGRLSIAVPAAVADDIARMAKKMDGVEVENVYTCRSSRALTSRPYDGAIHYFTNDFGRKLIGIDPRVRLSLPEWRRETFDVELLALRAEITAKRSRESLLSMNALQ